MSAVFMFNQAMDNGCYVSQPGIPPISALLSERKTPDQHKVLDQVIRPHQPRETSSTGPNDLERRVAERTAALRKANALLTRELAERQRMETEQDRLIAQLEAKNEALSRFTYTVSHDLKSPLVTIKGFLGLLERDAVRGNTARIQRDIEQINTAVSTMYRLLRELLELSRSGSVANLSEDVALTEVAYEAVALLNGEIATHGVDITIEPALPIIVGDHTRLLQVFQNLIGNAIKFMGNQPRPRIFIGMRPEQNDTVFFVQDNGQGIDRPYHKKVFGLFERLDDAIEGTGIGLSMVKYIVEAHGGRIWVESEGRGLGSTFCFTLPYHLLPDQPSPCPAGYRDHPQPFLHSVVPENSLCP